MKTSEQQLDPVVAEAPRSAPAAPRTPWRSARPKGVGTGVSSHAETNWLLSFGDLLTLLLCFFLLFLSQSRAKPTPQGAQGGGMTQQREEAPLEASRAFQPSGVGASLATVPVSAFADVFLTGEDIGRGEMEALRSLLRQAESSKSRLLVESCASRGPDAWSQAARSAVEIERALRKSASGTVPIDVRVVGSHCSSLPPNRPSGSVARISVQRYVDEDGRGTSGAGRGDPDSRPL